MIRLAPRKLALILCSATAAICLTPEVSRGAVITTGATVSSDFEPGVDDGWTIQFGTLSPQSSGGNPGAFLQLSDPSSNIQPYRILAPSAFLGNKLAFDGGTLSFAARIFSTPGASPNIFSGDVVIASTSGPTVTLDFAPSGFTTSWQTFQQPFAASAWGVSQSQWEAILSDITSITVFMEESENPPSTFDTTGFDTFVMAVPEPASGLLAGLAAIQGAVVLQWRRRRQKKAAQAAQTTAV